MENSYLSSTRDRSDLFVTDEALNSGNPKGMENGLWSRIGTVLSKPVSGESLAFLRIALGLIMVLEAISFFLPSDSSGGRSHLEVYYAGKDVTFNFPYESFSWLPLLPGPWIQGIVILMGVAGFAMALGYRYRIASVLTFLTWGYLYAVECTRTYWMSYFYLELLSLFLMMFMPAASRLSLDARRGAAGGGMAIPFWPLVVFRAQLIVTYFYAGYAKLTPDWLFEGVPVRIFLDKPWVIARLKAVLPSFLGTPEQWVHSPALIYFLSWAGAGFDLVIGFLLIARRTRPMGMLMMVMFHSFNHFILFTDIGWFPLLGVTTATIFLEPDWPTRFMRWLSKPHIPAFDRKWFFGGVVTIPLVGAALGWRAKPTPADPRALPIRLARFTVPFVVVWITFQALFPLRHYLIPGDVRFTFEGLSWSWRLKTEVYRCQLGVISLSSPSFLKRNPDGSSQFNWDQWPEEKTLFGQVTPSALDWSKLPELFVIFEPRTGDRILYNPLSSTVSDHSEAAATARIAELWTSLYGRKPELAAPTAPLARILEGYERAMRRRGKQFNSAAEVLSSFNSVREDNGELANRMPVLRRIDPFAWSSRPPKHELFFLVEDRQLLKDPAAPIPRIDASKWKNPPSVAMALTGAPTNASPMLVLHSELGMDEGEYLPRFYVAKSYDFPDRGIEVRWNVPRDVSISKGMHLSMQPFLLRRYSHRVADAWQEAHGQRPAVHARTSVSLNLHPGQPIVDPEADLASVRASWLTHNPWILDFNQDLKDTKPTLLR